MERHREHGDPETKLEALGLGLGLLSVEWAEGLHPIRIDR